MQPTVDIRRNFLFGGFRLEYRNALDLRVGALSALVDGYFSTLFPKLLAGNGQIEIEDFKGRNPTDRLDDRLPPPRTDELFSLHGRIAVSATKSGFEWDDFGVTGYSPFRRFEGSHHIVYGLEVERSGALPAWVPLPLLGRIAPVEPTNFRFGLEHFRSSIFSASLGYAPSVAESILVDANTERVLVKVTVESKKKDSAKILANLPILSDALGVLGKAAEVDLLDEFTRSLQ